MGVIDYEREHITVLDRSTLEEMACEFYDVFKQETNRLFVALGEVTEKNMNIACSTDRVVANRQAKTSRLVCLT